VNYRNEDRQREMKQWQWQINVVVICISVYVIKNTIVPIMIRIRASSLYYCNFVNELEWLYSDTYN
jgi:hypothetical protein